MAPRPRPRSIDPTMRGSSSTPSSFADTARQYRVTAMLGLPAPAPEDVAVSPRVAALMARAADVYAKSIKRETRRSYAHRWFDFEDWCRLQGVSAMPPTAETVIVYLQDLVDGPKAVSISTVRGRLAAISRISKEAGWPSPSRDPAMSMYMQALSHELGRGARKKQVKALKISPLRETVAALPHTDARMVRDRALIALRASGVPANAVANLKRDQVIVRPSGMWIKSPDLPDGRMRIHDGPGMPTRTSLSAWLALTQGGTDFLFNTTDENGVRSLSRISPGDVDRTVERRVAGFHLDPDADDTLGRAVELLSRPNGFALRDRAILLIGFAAAFRRVDLTVLRWQDVTDDPEGLLIFLPFSKTDRKGKGRTGDGGSIGICEQFLRRARR